MRDRLAPTKVLRLALRMLAREGAAILVRRWPIDSVVQSAAAADPALGELAARLRQVEREWNITLDTVTRRAISVTRKPTLTHSIKIIRRS